MGLCRSAGVPGLPRCASPVIAGLLGGQRNPFRIVPSGCNITTTSTLASVIPPPLPLMSHPIVKIDELLRLVIDELIETSPQTAVSLALTCRSLEEPTLSSLWRQQHLLSGLVRVLPNHTWVKDEYGFGLIIVSGHDFPANRSDINLSRRSGKILQQRTGPGCDGTLLGCVGYTSVTTGTSPAILSSDSHPIRLVGFCSPGWNGCAGACVERTSP